MVILPEKTQRSYQYASMIWAPEEKGIYSISALATDNVGEKTLSPRLPLWSMMDMLIAQ